MKTTIHKESLKQKEIVKATIFIAVGAVYVLTKIGGHVMAQL